MFVKGVKPPSGGPAVRIRPLAPFIIFFYIGVSVSIPYATGIGSLIDLN